MENMTIGQRIASRRKLANLSQEELSEQLGVSRQSVSKWESDASLPDIDKLIALSKVFNVSVGWILGTEKDPSFDPSTGLSDAQLRMVEKIVAKRRQKPWQKFFNIVIVLFFMIQPVIFNLQMSRINEDTFAKQQQISALEQQITVLKEQVEQTNNTLTQQKYENGLLFSSFTKQSLNDDGQSVAVDFYLIPKLYQENAQAYIIIRNDSIFDVTQIKCQPMGNLYFCRAELPLKNGYSYSFALAGDSGFEEQPLDNDFFTNYMQNLYDATRYHLDPSAETRSEWDIGESIYTFNSPIASPFIFFRDASVGYKSIDVTLYHNGTPIHKQSLRQELRDHGGAYMSVDEPFYPDIRAELPTLSEGDVLRLEISAECYNGEVLTNVLDNLTVVNN